MEKHGEKKSVKSIMSLDVTFTTLFPQTLRLVFRKALREGKQMLWKKTTKGKDEMVRTTEKQYNLLKVLKW